MKTGKKLYSQLVSQEREVYRLCADIISSVHPCTQGSRELREGATRLYKSLSNTEWDSAGAFKVLLEDEGLRCLYRERNFQVAHIKQTQIGFRFQGSKVDSPDDVLKEVDWELSKDNEIPIEIYRECSLDKFSVGWKDDCRIRIYPSSDSHRIKSMTFTELYDKYTFERPSHYDRLMEILLENYGMQLTREPAEPSSKASRFRQDFYARLHDYGGIEFKYSPFVTDHQDIAWQDAREMMGIMLEAINDTPRVLKKET
jgi:hypothetical protein|tara:strand:+ start:5072 stop:5842 length:771 start_codon:yes stop_codon:yes gene_type:complete